MPKAPGLTLPEGKDDGYPSYPASPTKTPLSNMAKLFRKGTQAVVIDEAHHQRCEDLQVQDGEESDSPTWDFLNFSWMQNCRNILF
eukprot:Skav213988  [mRNA]  locus=scaffold2843:51849:52671:+ [translate_table: standard]